MNALESCAASVGRAVCIGALAVAILPLLRAVAGRAAWCILITIYLTPSLIVSYAYQNHALLWQVDQPVLLETVYVLLITAKLAPLALLISRIAPPPPNTPAALYTARLAQQRSVRLWLAGPARTTLAAFGVVFLLAFGEFEIASVFNMKAWTVWLFDAQVGGLSLGESLKAAALPLACELAIIAALLWLLIGQADLRATHPRITKPPRRARTVGAWLLLASAFAMIVLYPAAHLLRSVVGGWDAVQSSLTVASDIGVSLWFAALSSAAAITVAFLLRQRGATLAVICCTPGLLGSLLVSLLVLAVFQLPLLAPAYHRPLPACFALTVLLLPPALILLLVFGATTDQRSEHLARQLAIADRLAASRLQWVLTHRRYVALGATIFYLGYFDLAASALLAPPGMTPIVTRMYNLMHYNQNAVLSAMLGIAVAAPLAFGSLAWFAAKAARRCMS